MTLVRVAGMLPKSSDLLGRRLKQAGKKIRKVELRRKFFGSLVYLFGCVGHSIRVDIYAYATTRTDHVLLRLQLPYRLFEVISAAWALKLNLIGVNVSHLEYASRPNN
jgi:hypothetical protein